MPKTTVTTTVTKKKGPKVDRSTKPKMKPIAKPLPKARSLAAIRGQRSAEMYFAQHIAAPDLYGPCQIPILGGGGRVIPCMDRTIGYLAGSSTNTIYGIGLANIVYSGESYRVLTATNSATNLSQGSAVAPSSQFPASTSLDDVELTAAVITVSYTGSVINAGGEVLLGSVSLDSSSGGYTAATYASLTYYPDVIRVPIASLIEKPLRVFMTKRSPDADAFYPVTNNVPDVSHPFILTSNLPVGQQISFEVTRTWQGTSTTNDSYALPYENYSESFSGDVNAWQNVGQILGTMATSVMDALPSDWSNQIIGGITNAGGMPGFASATALGIGGIAHRIYSNHVKGLGSLGRLHG